MLLKWLIKKKNKGGAGGFFAGTILALTVFSEMIVGFFLSVLICMTIEEIFGKGFIASLSIPMTMLPCMLIPFFRYYDVSARKLLPERTNVLINLKKYVIILV